MLLLFLSFDKKSSFVLKQSKPNPFFRRIKTQEENQESNQILGHTQPTLSLFFAKKFDMKASPPSCEISIKQHPKDHHQNKNKNRYRLI